LETSSATRSESFFEGSVAAVAPPIAPTVTSIELDEW